MLDLTNRELATVLLFAAFAVGLLAWNQTRSAVLSGAAGVLRAAASWKLLLPIALYGTYITVLVWIAHQFGLWDTSVLKDTVIVGVFVGLPMLFRASSVRDGSVLVRQVLGETVGVAALLAFYLNLASLPLWAELVLQVVATFLSLLVVAARAPEHQRVNAWIGRIIGAIGIGLLAFTTYKLVADPASTELPTAVASLAVAIWLPLALLPFVYVLAFVMTCELILKMLPFMNDQQPVPWKVKVAIVLGLRLSTRYASELNGGWRGRMARTRSFGEARSTMAEFRAAVRQRDQRLKNHEVRLNERSGAQGVDDQGLILDRREFAATKDALRGLYFNELGWRRNRGRFQPELEMALSAMTVRELPEAHGIEFTLNRAGTAWRAWRRTPSGYVFGIAGAASNLDAQWQYDGPTPPTSFPSQSGEWVNSTVQQGSREWDQDDHAPTAVAFDWEADGF